MTTSTLAISYIWAIPGLITTSIDSYDYVVATVEWALVGIIGDPTNSSGELRAARGGQQSITFDPLGFTLYSELTEAQVATWIQNILGPDQIAELKTIIADELEKLKNPQPVEYTPLPWM